MEDFAQRTNELARQSDLINEEVALMARIMEIRQELSTIEPPATEVAAPKAVATKVVKTAKVVVDGEPRRRGRPPGSKNKVKDAVKNDGKKISLPTLLSTISQTVNKPLTNAEFVGLVLQSGYVSKANDFSNMVYQSLLKLVKQGTFHKNDETRTFEYVAPEAA